LESNIPVVIRNPSAVRPWQHVLEPLGGYLALADKLASGQQLSEHAWNFGPQPSNCVTVKEIVESVIEHYGSGSLTISNTHPTAKETGLLMLDISRAKNLLGWNPILSIDESIKLTVDWYRNYRNRPTLDICVSQIDYYTKAWKSRN
jgi:CDP-glucose 4,6-dehydratase